MNQSTANTPQLLEPPPGHCTSAQAQAMASRMQRLAARQAEFDHAFLVELGEFDAQEAFGHFGGIKSTAHFVSFFCSMSGGAAREHVRVARALRVMPRVADLMRQGRFSYSKVRELTRINGLVDEDELCELALKMTASQLARTVAAYRSAAGTRIQALSKRRFSATPTPDGLVRITVVLPPEEAAVITSAVEAATRQAVPESKVDTAADALVDVPAGTHRPQAADRVQGIVDVAASYLETLPGDPADDHTLVMVQVSADLLLEQEPASAGPQGRDRLTCQVSGHGPIEPATAQRLICGATLLGVLTDTAGEVLRLGRSRRLASRAQRRALRVRDNGVCQFPGCDQVRHLDAHHVIPWFAGGGTDLDNLVLLCRRHHVHVHEGGVLITRSSEPGQRFTFSMPDGQPITGTWLAGISLDSMAAQLADLARRLAPGRGLLVASTPLTDARQHGAAVPARTQLIDLTDPDRVFPPTGGAGFSLAECVRVLFDIEAPEVEPAA